MNPHMIYNQVTQIPEYEETGQLAVGLCLLNNQDPYEPVSAFGYQIPRWQAKIMEAKLMTALQVA